MLVEDDHEREYSLMEEDVLREELRAADKKILQLTNQLEITDLFPQIERLQCEVERLKDENQDLRRMDTTSIQLDNPDIMADDLRRTQDTLASTKTSLAEERQRVADLEHTLSTLTSQKGIVDGRLQQMQAEISELHGIVSGRRDSSELLQGRFEDLLIERDAACAKIADLERRVVEVEQGGEGVAEREEAAVRENEALRRENETLRDDMNRVQVRLAVLTTENAALSSEASEEGVLRAQNSELHAQNISLKATSSAAAEAAQSRVNSLCEEVLALREEKEALQREASAAAALSGNFSSEANQLHEELASLTLSQKQEKAKNEVAASRISDLNLIVDDYRSLIDMGKAENEKLKEKLASFQSSMSKQQDETAAALKMQKQNKLLREKIALLNERIVSQEDEKAKMKREYLIQHQKVQDVSVSLSRSQEKEKNAGRDLKKTRDELKALKEALKSSAESSLQRQVDELTIANAVLKEMVRSANINSRVAIARKQKGIRRPSQSTLLQTTTSIEHSTRQPHPSSQHHQAYIPTLHNFNEIHKPANDHLAALIEANTVNYMESGKCPTVAPPHEPINEPPPNPPQESNKPDHIEESHDHTTADEADSDTTHEEPPKQEETHHETEQHDEHDSQDDSEDLHSNSAEDGEEEEEDDTEHEHEPEDVPSEAEEEAEHEEEEDEASGHEEEEEEEKEERADQSVTEDPPETDQDYTDHYEAESGEEVEVAVAVHSVRPPPPAKQSIGEVVPKADEVEGEGGGGGGGEAAAELTEVDSNRALSVINIINKKKKRKKRKSLLVARMKGNSEADNCEPTPPDHPKVCNVFCR